MIDKEDMLRIEFLLDVASKERKHLLYSDRQLFKENQTHEQMCNLMHDDEFAETAEAFASRFARFQDTVGAKLLPIWLKVVGEKSLAFIDNLNKAEKLGLLDSADRWMMLRGLRNKMVHEYIDDPNILIDALATAHDNISLICQLLDNISEDLKARGYTTR